MKTAIGCGSAILKNKKVLLTKRISIKRNFPNCWTFPAGTLKNSDTTLEAAAARETKEEVNITFIPNKKLGFYETNTKNTRFIGFIFLGEWTGNIKPLDSEISDIGWFSYKEANKLKMAFSYDKAIKDLYNQNLIE